MKRIKDDDVFLLADVALSNQLREQHSKFFAVYGYDEDKIGEGRAICDNAYHLYNQQQGATQKFDQLDGGFQKDCKNSV